MQINQALPTLAPTLAKCLSHMRNKARLSRSAQEGIWRLLGTYRCTMRLGFDTSFTWSPSRSVLFEWSGMDYQVPIREDVALV